jgi:hypothetical protein
MRLCISDEHTLCNCAGCMPAAVLQLWVTGHWLGAALATLAADFTVDSLCCMPSAALQLWVTGHWLGAALPCTSGN